MMVYTLIWFYNVLFNAIYETKGIHISVNDELSTEQNKYSDENNDVVVTLFRLQNHIL